MSDRTDATTATDGLYTPADFRRELEVLRLTPGGFAARSAEAGWPVSRASAYRMLAGELPAYSAARVRHAVRAVARRERLRLRLILVRAD